MFMACVHNCVQKLHGKRKLKGFMSARWKVPFPQSCPDTIDRLIDNAYFLHTKKLGTGHSALGIRNWAFGTGHFLSKAIAGSAQEQPF